MIHLVSGARPNFMKIAPLYHALKGEPWCDVAIVHTGQHYDKGMFSSFFEELGLPDPHYNLNVGSGSHAEQTAKVMVAYEKLCVEHRPDLVIVVGDVNSTFAACLSAKKLGIKVAHLEAGLRCFDRTMPEEINRVLTDSICDYHWTPSLDADENLVKEGIAPEKIHFVGNIMIDSYMMLEKKIAGLPLPQGIEEKKYAVVTIHRPSNTDERGALTEVVDSILKVSELMPLVFPVHPRTESRLNEFGLKERLQKARVQLMSPFAYTEFMRLLVGAAFVVTDSGGIQEETSFLGVPCFTVRDTTERPITITEGTNRLVTFKALPETVQKVLSEPRKPRPSIAYWDGKTASRIVSLLKKLYNR